MPIIVQFQNVADRLGLFGADFFHQPDGTFNDVTQLTRSLVRPLQNGGGSL
ncbi:hypothetical protein [Devosia ureilytica]|uniref:hypothetical protein n=1 Tax=Devosia ureilytica TaxID=2952754 RepID=UPI0020C77D76|nr:hypothetical protein [Devosia ureilytica]